MLCELLLSGQFQRYFEAVLSRPALWLFVHVPKTAGSSLNGELVPILSPSYHILIDYAQLERRSFSELMDESVGRFIETALEKRYEYCTGHITAAQVERIVTALPTVRPMTLLRDPVARFISDYRYQCSSMHPGHEQFLRMHPTIETYLDRADECNKMAGHLVPRALCAAGDQAACIEHIVKRHDFIGVQEMYALSLRLITTLAGTPRRPSVQKRMNSLTPDDAALFPASIRARIRDRNALDAAIYDDIAARFRTISSALADFLEIVDPLPPAGSAAGQ